MAKGKRVEAAKKEEGDYEFKVPNFDEKAFVRREVEGAKAAFWTVGLGTLSGIIATVVVMMGSPWLYGWFPILLSLAVLRPMLQRMNYSEDIVKPKALVGSYFMLFFTGLAIWVIGVNFAP